MGDFIKTSFQLFRTYAKKVMPMVPEMKEQLKQASMPYTPIEYVSMTIFVGFLALVTILPTFSFVIGLLIGDFLFGFLLAILAGFGISAGIFFFVLYYPKIVINDKAGKIKDAIPFTAMYLSTIAGSNLPLYKVFQIYAKFSAYGEMANQINKINEDVKVFGMDVITALERAIDRSPSKDFKEMLYGMLSTMRSGADMNIYLKEKSKVMMAEYRSRLYEFSQTLTVFIEVYLTAIVLGAIFFTVLTAIISGIGAGVSGGSSGDVILLQFFLVFVMMPLISFLFIWIIKTSTPGGE